MAKKISWSFTVKITDGPSTAVIGSMEVDAYDEMEATVTGGGGTTTVGVQPGDGARFILITASSYEDMTYEVDGSGTAVTLDGAHILIGEGAASLLGNTQNSIAFTNNGTEDVSIRILVGRNATT